MTRRGLTRPDSRPELKTPTYQILDLLLLLFHCFFIVFLKVIHLFGYPATSV